MLHRRASTYIGSTPYLRSTASPRPNSSPRWRSRRTTRSASRSSRSCGRACSRRGSARRRDSRTTMRETAYWVALLRYVGCTGHAHEVATLFGDEIAIRAQTLVHDAANPTEVMGDVVAYATAGRSEEERDEIIRMLAADRPRVGGAQLRVRVRGGRHARASASTSAPAFARRWASRSSAGTARAFPTHASGEAIPLPMRVVHLSHDMEAIGRLFSPDHALEAARDRRDRTYDPALADLFVDARTRLVRAAPRDRAVGCRARPRARAPTACSRARPSITHWRSPPTSSTSSRRTWAGTAVAARSSPPTPRGCSGSRRKPPPRSAGRRSCTTSAPPRCRTRSGTSPARSRGRSSTASSCTRC